MVMRRRDSVTALAAVVPLVLAACGLGNGARDAATVEGPAPGQMCTAPQVPVVAAYDVASGVHSWHVCGDPAPWYSLDAATADMVYVGASFDGAPPTVIGLDAATGVEQWRGDLDRMEEQLPAEVARPMSEAPTVDGVALSGGQDDPLVATDAESGAELWRSDDRLVYDDVWAVGDGAAYMSHQTGSHSVVVAYELTTGETRWEQALGEESYPWWVDGERVFSSWTNVSALRTDDGSVLWSTDYAQTDTGFPAPRAILTNDTTAFVSFASSFGGGD